MKTLKAKNQLSGGFAAYMGRRDFLAEMLATGAVAAASGCVTRRGGAGSMIGFRAPPMERVRFGVIGIGARGTYAVNRLSGIPGAEVTAVCDVRPEALAAVREFFTKRGERCPKEYLGAEAWKGLCDDPEVDFVYNCTPWNLHVAPAVRAMGNGKHAAIEVPAAPTVEDAWEIVETAERTRRHCMMLENGCYNERRGAALNLCRQGVLGDILYGEAYYTHDLRSMFFPDEKELAKPWYSEHWRIDWFREHRGNTYPTHGLGPLALIMGVNRGDAFDYLVSMETPPVGQDRYARLKYGAEKAGRLRPVVNGDVNATLIRTKLGKTVYLVHDVTSPRPGRRLGLIQGTRGALDVDPDFKLAVEAKEGAGAEEWKTEIDGKKVLDAYRHPFWRELQAEADRVAARCASGGHNVQDAIMDLRLVHCLRKGLPLDQSVYDLAAWSAVCELSERSVRGRSASVDFPDFTRGAWSRG